MKNMMKTNCQINRCIYSHLRHSFPSTLLDLRGAWGTHVTRTLIYGQEMGALSQAKQKSWKYDNAMYMCVSE